MNMASLRFLVATLFYAGLPLALATQCHDLKPKSNPQVAPGVQFKVLANDLKGPRGIVADSKGNLLVVEGAGHGIRRIVLNHGAGLETCVTSSTQLVAEKSVCVSCYDAFPCCFGLPNPKKKRKKKGSVLGTDPES